MDAAVRKIADGDLVRLFNDRGQCILPARISDNVKCGVVAAKAVRWPKMAGDGNTVNMLTSERLTDKGGGPAFYSCLVNAEKVGD